MLDDQGAPKPQSVRLDMLLDPLFASGSERAEQENCALIANQNVRGTRNNLRRTAHGCVLLGSNTHQVTKQKKRLRIRRSRGDRLHSVPHQPFGLPPCSPNVGWSRFRAVLMLTAIVPASAIGWNGTKVGSVIHRDLISKISGQNKTRVAPDIPPLLNRGALLCSIFPYTHGLLPYNRLLLWPNKPRAHSVRKWCAPSNVERTSDSIAVWGA